MSMKNKNMPRYRNEWKYLLSEAEAELLRLRMKPVFQLDSHAGENGYTIRSLYFDDYFDRAFEEKEMGIFSRCKYRIRIYNFSDTSIKLERKKKVGSYIFKEDARLTRKEVEQILEGEFDFLLHSPQSLCREFYIECTSCVMRPRVIVDYERIPYIQEAGTVRITFDRHVRAAVLGNDIFDPELPALETLDPGREIMEVKFTEFLPQIVRNILPPSASEFTAVSKYVLCYQKTQYRNGWGYWEDQGGRL